MQFIEGGVTAAKGFLAGGIHCGIRKNKSKADLAMIFSKTPCAAAGVYTQNLVKGAPILVTRKNIADGRAQAVICNSGNANKPIFAFVSRANFAGKHPFDAATPTVCPSVYRLTIGL